MNNKKQKISVLPNNLVNLIAAGEVVERPASVLKELLDNSIDAGATQVKIYLEDGGMKGLKVVDNGSGMIPEDAVTAFLPHSTSKIKDEKDLESILTLGFRGEALASISSVSKVELITKTDDSVGGYRVLVEGSEIKEEGEFGSQDGTSINIREIFFNTPARRKFLKTTSTELRHVIKMFTELALANPQIGFELYHNEKNLFKLPSINYKLQTTNSLKERIRNLIGKDFTENSFEIYYDGIIKISGFAGLPKIATARKATQIIIVNGRPIANSTIIAAVKDAYHSAMPKNLYPQFVMNIEVDPKKVDVNVHPRKLEVRFSEPQEIFKAVKYAIQAGLEKALQLDTNEKLSAIPSFQRRGDSANAESGWSKTKTERRSAFPTNYKLKTTNSKNYKLQNLNTGSVQDSLDFTESLLGVLDDKPLPWESVSAKATTDFGQKTSNKTETVPVTDTEALYPAHQLLNAYIVTTNGSAIQIIDQHAAAERVTYERLMKNFGESQIQTQALLIPFELNLNAQELLVLNENIDYLKSFGIEIEEFGINALVVREVPIELKDADLNLFVKEMLNDLVSKESDEKNQLEILKEKILTTIACHSSIRVGDRMTQEAIDKLINDLRSCDLPYSCPHGRPIIYEVPISELEKKFKRK